jgi:hypothetical protein
MGRVDNTRIRRTALRNAQFVSFVGSSGSLGAKRGWADRHDRRLLRQKWGRVLAWAGASAGLGWVALESARAIAQF